ncbi:Prenylated rab acceptor PRA1 [Corchorus capsularis]|uniref:PRA1 family protein n=1 Tax=Corchorus capsularis TaxID=210143 RepID=A0A1R3IK50_COCAP|nr:Prenylated rab acceptor PRA1 [Corchorus capsularis]
MSTMLPVSDSNAESRPSTLTPNLRAILTRISGSARQALSRCRPWTELIDRSAFAKPVSFADATSRVRKNFSYFRANYLTVLAGVLAISLISHPFSLIILLLLISAWLFLYALRPSDQPVVIWGRTYSDMETLAILVILTVVVIFFSSVGSLLISGTMMGVAIVCAHGAFRMPEDLFLDEQEQLGSGLFSFVDRAASSAVAAAAPAIASRV